MGRITLRQAASWCGGWVSPKYEDVTFYGANNDTRKLEAGQLFVALQGARDGHDFISAAFQKGAAAVLCTHCDGDYPAIIVSDTRIALGDIARGERQRLNCRVVGITGSVGKSTTKEMVASVLKSTYRVGKSPVNYNNDIGLPLSILAMPEDTQVAVLEMGMNHFGEIAYLSGIAKPDVAVIVNIGTMHIEHLGSKEGILQAKLEILEGMCEGGDVVLNGDDPLLWNFRESIKGVTYFGKQNSKCGVFGANVAQRQDCVSFDVQWAADTMQLCLPMEGEHYVEDALAAVAVGCKLGVLPEKIVSSLNAFENMEDRQEIYCKGDYTIIKDCYNAGPESMAAALNVLSSKPGRRIAVLGEMLELGDCTPAEHYRIGRLAAEKADVVVAYGPNSERVLKGAVTGGMSGSRVSAYTDREQVVTALRQLARPGDVFLFKGSRGMRMELILEAFLLE